MERVRQYGTVRLTEFMPSDQQEAILSSINSATLEKVDEKKGTTHFYDKVEYNLDESCPPAILDLGQKISETFGTDYPLNEVSVQKYPVGKGHVAWHQDWPGDMGIIAIASIGSPAPFEVQLTGMAAPRVKWETKSGDLVIMCGSGITPGKDGRPFHKVNPPTTGERTALVYRHVTQKTRN